MMGIPQLHQLMNLSQDSDQAVRLRIELQDDESSYKTNQAARRWIELQDGESSYKTANRACESNLRIRLWAQLIALLGHHSIEPWSLLVVMSLCRMSQQKQRTSVKAWCGSLETCLERGVSIGYE